MAAWDTEFCSGSHQDLLSMYLKEFRTEQCPLFLQHKCTQHRPFTCFHWHFLNQRRRRPIRRRDGTFNYSPDVYCTKYDETTGMCQDGDDCPYLHRTTGDTERKYHLRYYKTGTCIHETDSRGHCVKNGPHCAFAHGPHDLRPPVYDIREIQAQEALQNGQLGSGEGIPDLQPGVLASQAMIEKILGEDPRWQDTNFVLASYKTEQCTKPPRLCRQGYACPHYHNSRDRRRNPRKFKYRSTPCPSVKHGDEWGEPSKCESGDSCQYCHSRTEQQFHPEIYKSTKCNDVRQTGYCPRGPFCAFAHVERIPSTEETMNVMMQSSHLKQPSLYSSDCLGLSNDWNTNMSCTNNILNHNEQTTNAKHKCLSLDSNHKVNDHEIKQSHLSVFSVVNPLASSITSSITSSLASSIGSDSSSPTALSSSVNAKALPFYPTSNTVESVIGSALDLHFSNINVASLDKEFDDTENCDLGLSSQRLLGSSAPVNIPGSLARSSSLHSSSSLSTSPLSSLSQSLSQSYLASSMAPRQHQAHTLKSEHSTLGTSSSSHNSLGLNGVTGSIWDFVSGSFSPSPSPVFSSGPTSSTSTSSNGNELSRIRRELDDAKRKIKRWEDSWQQVKQACDAWQKEAQEAKERAKVADADRQLALLQKEEVEGKLKNLQEEFDVIRVSPQYSALRKYSDMEKLPLPKLHSLKSQLCSDLETVDGLIFQLHSKKCVVCHENDSIVLQSCQHYILCEQCASSKPECPYCKTKRLKW
ncbi:putative E3 ubiquitin-protein ligase UNKL isoform X2 [Rana temporaria]|uniref:putative E3 ubiquitin-protein ligase UNKL isoform X2 n=1 Tax=Rana temporaria TaxID=8407 RepID=UPI001AACEA62|nr:putative E3 ubiquitin-protein ligase UNKL isoform X2 [Rana temporaria]XP_040212666.1 putative E3 ubiquitin-protein ligase UNKL isoform X2 [Rana temporaria]